MNFFVQHSGLRDLCEKVAAGEPVSDANALRLFESKIVAGYNLRYEQE